MKAFTIATPNYLEMAGLCRDRVLKFCGIEQFDIREVASPEEAFATKLSAWLSYQEPVWFVDADFWFIREAPLAVPSGPMIIAAPQDCPNQGEGWKWCMDQLPAFNITQCLSSALVGMDMGNKVCREVVLEAIALQNEFYVNGGTNYDEKFLNLAAHKHPQMMVARLGNKEWNWCAKNPSSVSRAVHAACVYHKPDKLDWLKEHAGVV